MAAIWFRPSEQGPCYRLGKGDDPMNAYDTHPFESNLDRHPANYVPLSPVSFLTRAASCFADKVAVIDGERRHTYAQLLDRCIRLASGLAQLGDKRLDTVSIIAS